MNAQLKYAFDMNRYLSHECIQHGCTFMSNCNMNIRFMRASSSSSSYLWGSLRWVRFLRMWSFSSPAIEVVTFCLHRWCMLGVFLLLTIVCLGHECQHLWSPCDGMRVCTDQDSVYTLIRKCFGGGMESEPMLTPREKSPLPEAQRRIEATATSCRTASPTRNCLSYSSPHECI